MPNVSIPGKGVVRFPDNMTPEQIQRVIETEISPAPTPDYLKPISRTASDGAPMPPLYNDAPSSPPPEPEQGTLANLAISAQGAARGLADVAGAPVDLATGALNLGSYAAERAINAIPGVDGVQTPRIYDPVGGSQNIADLGSMAAEAIGLPVADPAQLELDDKLAYNANRYGVNALATGAGLRGPAISRAAAVNRTPKMGDALLRPYETGAAQPHVGDVAAGVGQGTALAAGDEYLPEDLKGPMSDFVLSLLGGAGGATVASTLRSPRAALEAATDTLPDSSVPMMPAVPATSYTDEVKIPVSRGAVKRAAEYTQQNATDPLKARADVKERAQSFRDEGLPVPTTGTLSGDIGLGAVEQGDRVRNPVPYQEADQRIRTAASDQLSSVAPEGAEPRAATEFANKDAAQRRASAAANVTAAEKNAAIADVAEQAVAQPFRTPPDKGAASRALDEVVVDETMKPRQQAKNQKFANIPDAERDIAPLADAAAKVRDSLGALNDPNSILPQGTLARIEALTAKKTAVDSGEPATFKVDPQGVSEKVSGGPVETTTGGTVRFQDMNKLRPELTDAIRAARRAGNYTLADNLKALKREIGNEAERMAAEGSPEAADALKYFKDEFAPYFGDGTIGGKLKDAINRDTDRVNTPPSATADRFLNVAAGAKEAAADLRRILSIAPDQAKGAAAVRQYVLSDMSKVVNSKGTIEPRAMRDWYTKRKDMLSEFPELDAEVKKLLGDVVNSRTKTNATAKELKDAMSSAKLTEDDIRRGNLSLLLDSSPDVAVTKVFGAKDREKAMADIVKTLSQDKDALAGWKKAVSEHMQKKLTGTNTQMTDGPDGPVQFAAMKKFFDENRATLAKVYSPAEMNALQKTQKLLEPFGALSRRATTGSPTAENNTQAWRTLEAGLKAYYGVLKGGGVLRTFKLAAATLPNSDAQVGWLVHKMQFDPELAVHLLGVPLKQVGTPGWNSKLNRLLGYEEASRLQRDETKTDSRK